MPSRVLNDDWSDYDNKKKKAEDRKYFSCEESWEVDYLVKKIKKFEPNKQESIIRQAIHLCCRLSPAPRPREVFVRHVMGKL